MEKKGKRKEGIIERNIKKKQTNKQVGKKIIIVKTKTNKIFLVMLQL